MSRHAFRARALQLTLAAVLLASRVGAENVPLTLQGAVLLALDRSPELRVEKLTAKSTETGIEEALGAFDPTLSATLAHGESQTPTTARESALEQSSPSVRVSREDVGTLKVSKDFATGTEVTLAGDTTRSRSNFSAEEFGSNLALSVTQPLLRGLRPSVNLARVRLAENNTAIGRYALDAAVQDLLAGVEGAYWDLHLARRSLEVRVESLETARRLLAETGARVEAGRSPRVDLAAARAEVAAREEAAADGQAELERARLELLRWLGPDTELPWSSALEPVDDPMNPEEPPPPEDAVHVALASRPDLLQARLELSNGDLAVLETRDGLLPRLDLFGSYRLTGRDTTFRGSWQDVVEKGYETWRLQLNVESSLGLRAERARARRAEFDRDRAEASVENLELLIESQVRQGVVEVARLRRKVELASVTADARRDEAEAEKARYDAGRSTASDVLQAENRYREARLGYEQSRADLRRAWTEFVRLEGMLAEEWGVEVF